MTDVGIFPPSVAAGTHDQLIGLRDAALAGIEDEMKHRPVVGDPVFGTMAWVRHERAAIVEAVNTWVIRERCGRVITVDEAEAVEGLAVGHSDYASKFALYVAELALGRRHAHQRAPVSR